MTAHAATSPAGARSSVETPPSRGFFGRIIQFLREVLAELKKVTYPSRSQLLRFTIVVLAFVAVMMLLVTGLDFVFGRGALWLFGGPSGS